MAEWNADLVAKLDNDRALKVQIDELRRTYRGLVKDAATSRSFQGQLVQIILAAGYPPLTDLSQMPNGRFLFTDGQRRAVFLPAPVQLEMMEAAAVGMKIEGDGDWRSTVMDRLIGR